MAAESDFPNLVTGRKAGALTFSAIFALESLVRSLNSTVVSLQAYDLLGSSQKVSELTTLVAMVVLLATLMLPYVLGRLRRRWAYTLGVVGLIAASLFFASFTISGQIAGMFLRNCGAGILNITLSLYIMDHIKKSDLAHAEPLRLSLSTFSWMIGPAGGVWLYTQFGPWAPQLASIAVAVALLVLFWVLRLSDSATMPSGTLQPFNPLANVMRFVRQPRLRLAWMVAFGRSCFWTTFFIYGPLLMVESGVGKQVGGLMISASQVLLLFAYVFGRLAHRFGVRAIISLCFLLMALSSVAAGIAGKEFPYVAMFFLLFGAFAASGLDGVGGIPFLRAVRTRERQRMAAVYRTYIDFSDLIPAMIFAVALSYFEIGIVFVILGTSLVIMGALAFRYLPKSM
ncbi:MAG: MFS transporter [Hyphomicrobiales bacterium]|mgnify:FL=1|nr:MFS transporter [Hyphomicrobiales bacterium]MCC7482023.1 MFS transporter [Hyphomicrobiales bacterium]